MINRERLEQIDVDIGNIEVFVNGPADQIITTRLGQVNHPTLAGIILELSQRDVGDSAAAIINQRIDSFNGDLNTVNQDLEQAIQQLIGTAPDNRNTLGKVNAELSASTLQLNSRITGLQQRVDLIDDTFNTITQNNTQINGILNLSGVVDQIASELQQTSEVANEATASLHYNIFEDAIIEFRNALQSIVDDSNTEDGFDTSTIDFIIQGTERISLFSSATRPNNPIIGRFYRVLQDWVNTGQIETDRSAPVLNYIAVWTGSETIYIQPYNGLRARDESSRTSLTFAGQDRGWIISSRELNLFEFGLVGDTSDISEPLRAAIELGLTFDDPSIMISLPYRSDYTWNQQTTINVPNNRALKIILNFNGSTVLIPSSNTDGGLNLTYRNSKSCVEIINGVIFYDHAGQQVPNILSLNGPFVESTSKSLSISNVSVTALDPTASYFQGSSLISITGNNNATLENVTAVNGNFSNSRFADSDRFKIDAAISMFRCNSINLIGVKTDGCELGLDITNSSGDITIDRCRIKGAVNGMNITGNLEDMPRVYLDSPVTDVIGFGIRIENAETVKGSSPSIENSGEGNDVALDAQPGGPLIFQASSSGIDEGTSSVFFGDILDDQGNDRIGNNSQVYFPNNTYGVPVNELLTVEQPSSNAHMFRRSDGSLVEFTGPFDQGPLDIHAAPAPVEARDAIPLNVFDFILINCNDVSINDITLLGDGDSRRSGYLLNECNTVVMDGQSVGDGVSHVNLANILSEQQITFKNFTDTTNEFNRFNIAPDLTEPSFNAGSSSSSDSSTFGSQIITSNDAEQVRDLIGAQNVFAVDVRRFGAVVDPFADPARALQNSNAINQAMSEVESQGGGIVLIPNGEIILDRDDVANGNQHYSLLARKGVHLRGVTRASSKLSLCNTVGSINGASCHILYSPTPGIDDFSMTELTLNGNRDNQTNQGDNVGGNDPAGILINGTRDFEINNWYLHKLNIENMFDYGIGGQGDSLLREIYIGNIVIRNTGSDNIDIKSFGGVSNGIIENIWCFMNNKTAPAQAAIDVRTSWILRNIIIEDLNDDHRGIRVVQSEFLSRDTIISGFKVIADNPENTVGIAVGGSNVRVSDFNIENTLVGIINQGSDNSFSNFGLKNTSQPIRLRRLGSISFDGLTGSDPSDDVVLPVGRSDRGSFNDFSIVADAPINSRPIESSHAEISKNNFTNGNIVNYSPNMLDRGEFNNIKDVNGIKRSIIIRAQPTVVNIIDGSDFTRAEWRVRILAENGQGYIEATVTKTTTGGMTVSDVSQEGDVGYDISLTSNPEIVGVSKTTSAITISTIDIRTIYAI